MTRKKSNPLLRTRRPLLPPGARSRSAHLLTAAAARGDFVLPCCAGCGRFLWPMAEGCPACLSEVGVKAAPQGARVISATTAEVPAAPYFRERAPWRVGLVQMEAGPQAVVHLHPAAQAGDKVVLRLVLDRAGQAVLNAGPEGGEMSDPQWQAMVADPRDRRVLITDARHVCALPLAQGLAKAGAVTIHCGLPEAWKPFPGRAALQAVPGVRIVPLDVISDRSVADAATDMAGRVEIVVNTADLPRPGGLLGPVAQVEARAMAETVQMGLLRLARAFGPALAGRGADGDKGGVAWVNVLSVFARAHPPGWAGYAAAHAAALALSHALRADLAAGGVRLVTVLTGPTEDGWFQTVDPPKVTARALADAILKALTNGLEEVAVGDVAKDLLARLEENPKAVERELAQGGLTG
ncbi:MAG: SDR family NAD(P)-dependent oxidoreductase [Pseudooceanicola sp.]|nr:SDR family NAD(P)-dependent oxidoreductase [Pseudooceanicola sp.]